MAIDRESWLYRTGQRLLVTTAALFVLGLVCLPLQNRVWGEVKTFQPELNLRDVESALGQGMVIGLLGGFRTLLADFVYLRANFYWEKYDRPNTEALLALTTSIDPRPMYFWLNGARIISYDIPVWRIREKGGFQETPQFYQDEIFREQVERAVAMLDRAEKFHPDDPKIPLEKARIYFDKVKNYNEAAKNYKRVIEMPGAPQYAYRIYAIALDKAGRPKEAYNFLKKYYLGLDMKDPRSMPEVVLERIRELEDRLDIPYIERLPAQPSEVGDQFDLAPFGQSPLAPPEEAEEPFKATPNLPPKQSVHDHTHDHDHAHDH